MFVVQKKSKGQYYKTTEVKNTPAVKDKDGKQIKAELNESVLVWTNEAKEAQQFTYDEAMTFIVMTFNKPAEDYAAVSIKE